MIKLLVKKQFKELFGSLSKKPDGSRRGRGAVIAYGFLLVFVFLMFAGMFAFVSAQLCDIFHEFDMDWAFFAFSFIAAAAVGLVGSIFAAYSALYNAKDNDFLLAMPIKPSQILFARMLTIYIFSLAFELVVLLPAIVIFQIRVGFSLPVILLFVLVAFCMSLMVFALIIGLGFVVAKAASRIRNKSIAVTILSIVLFLAYFLLMQRISDVMMAIINKALAIGRGLESNLNPFYHMGRAIFGSPVSILITILLAAVMFGLCYWLTSRTFISIVTVNRGMVQKKFNMTGQKSASLRKALYLREMRHLIKSPNLLLNSCMATLMMLVLSVVAVIKARDLLMLITLAQSEGADLSRYITMAVAAVMAFLISMNVFTASCISIEGNKYLWLLRSAPVSSALIIRVKLGMHLIITALPALICTLIIALKLDVSIGKTALLFVFVAAVSVLLGCFGLIVNLKHPRMDWTSEIMVIKQSTSVMITMFGGMGIAVALVLPYFLIFKTAIDWIYLLVVTVIAAAAALAAYRWLFKKGILLFEKL